MNKILGILGPLLCLLPATAQAGLDLTWNACNSSLGHDSDVVFDCADRAAGYNLFGCFQSPTRVDRFTGGEFSISILIDFPSVPAFWHFEPGGCNSVRGLVASPTPGGLCSGATSVYGGTGCAVNQVFLEYQPGNGGLNRARLFGTIVPCTPIPSIEAGPNYFGFMLRFSMMDAGSCGGCPSRATIVWESATLHGAAARGGTEASQVTVTGPGLTSECATVNRPGSIPCGATPARDRTWGALKAFYR